MRFLLKFNFLLISCFGILINTDCASSEIAKNSKESSSEMTPKGNDSTPQDDMIDAPILVGAARTDAYLNQLKGRKVGLIVNQTSTVKGQHLVDWLISENIEVQKIFAPEHGFRGTADAGQQIKNGADIKTGLPIISLYGKNKKPTQSQMAGLDLIIFDIQDVGARFYTYISTMHYVMEACAEQNVDFWVFDRPNPNGHYVAGPILQPAYQSFVGMHPVPVVHGMTVGEYAQMVNGEGWLANGKQCSLSVVTCQNYTHDRPYELPIKPSPNLPNPTAIYLYPSLCFLEGTTASAGRGTNLQFQIYGHPDYSGGDFEFTPVSMGGAKYPKHENKVVYGYNLSEVSLAKLRNDGLNLNYLIDFYRFFPNKEAFFLKNNFFDKLSGTDALRKDIIAGKTAKEIEASWKPGIERFEKIRKKYLLYP